MGLIVYLLVVKITATMTVNGMLFKLLSYFNSIFASLRSIKFKKRKIYRYVDHNSSRNTLQNSEGFVGNIQIVT